MNTLTRRLYAARAQAAAINPSASAAPAASVVTAAAVAPAPAAGDVLASYRILREPYWRPVADEVALYEAAYAVRMPMMLKGPTGCGKTRFVEYMAWHHGEPPAPADRPASAYLAHRAESVPPDRRRSCLHGRRR